MNIDLSKKDLVNLVKGQSPYYNVMNNPLVKQCGNYVGGFYDKWNWHSTELEKLTEEQLYQLYTLCKDSWK